MTKSVSNFMCDSIHSKMFSSRVIMLDSIITKCIIWCFIYKYMSRTRAHSRSFRLRWRNLFDYEKYEVCWLSTLLDLLNFKDKISFHINNSIIYYYGGLFLYTKSFYALSFQLKWHTQLVDVANVVPFDFQYDSLHWSNQPLESMALHATHI